MEVAMTSLTQRSRLTADDRCDRCGAQAYVQAELLAGAELLFCAHHARQYQDKLTEVAIVIHDETSRLVESPTSPDTMSGAARN
jgi:ribosomal protein L37E